MSEILYNADVRDFTTFGIPAKAAMVIYYDSEQELMSILADTTLPRPLKHLGQGSNILFTEDFPGTILISRIAGYEVTELSQGRVMVAASAGTVMDTLCRDLADRGVWGLENLSGIPGTVGASAVQNVGAYGVEAGNRIALVEAVDTVTLRRYTLTRDMMQFGYRHSAFKCDEMRDRYIILTVHFELTSIPSPQLDYANLRSIVGDNPSACDMRNAVIAIRDSKLPDPARVGSAGSFFKNPVISSEQFARIEASMPDCKVPRFIVGEDEVKIPAAWLIDKAGCKEMTEGGASLWPRQPLVIVNTDGTATGSDVTRLERRIIMAVDSRFGITLHPEVEHI
ncbi:MAG: UDP-N-acetylmuramate dehydrogenase [Bacteroidales bacterium]|nr:UDP-N-acetylmuramate dehydrogenase [Bacteroidales bacterium]